MIIHVEQSGGFAGLKKRMEVDTNKIPKGDAVMIKKLVDSSDLNKNSLVSSKKPLKGAADYYTYEITIREGTKNQVIRCEEYSIHDNLKKLISYVEKVRGYEIGYK